MGELKLREIEMNSVCQKCGYKLEYIKYKQVLEADGWYFTVHLVYCPQCGNIDDDLTYVE